MKYLDYINDEIKEYYMILCNNDYPYFIDKYINTKDIKRLDGVGFFCGCDYSGLFKMKFWYSRLHHSVACALMMWNFTKNKEQTLSALFHDMGSPAFSHCIDFLLNDPVNQESSELNVKDIINNSVEIKALLKEDNINIEDINDVSNYPIMENNKPKICVDRLEGILCTGLIWTKIWSNTDIKNIYKDISVLEENNIKEVGFNTLKIANDFFRGVYKYSIILQQNEDKFTLKYISDILNELIENNKLSKDDLYILSEDEIIKLIKKDNELKIKWDIINNIKHLNRSEIAPNSYYVSTEIKKKYVIPLIRYKNEILRLDKVSKTCKKLLDKYLEYKDSLYSYIEV